MLHDVPGLTVMPTGGPGGLTSVFIRGTNANQTKVLIDGIDVSDPSSPDGAFDFAHILDFDIGSVEVLRGPQSGLYGSDAIGGVINIVTKKGQGPSRSPQISKAARSEPSTRRRGVSGSHSALQLHANIAHYRSDDTPVTPINLLAPGRARIDDFYDNRQPRQSSASMSPTISISA